HLNSYLDLHPHYTLFMIYKSFAIAIVFPSVEGGYLNQDNFLNRQWRPVVIKLYQSGKISQYLPCYNLRHSFITRLIRDGYDPSTVAALVGNSPQVILDHYLAAKKDLTLPEL
ncbi:MULTISPECIES: hypothetical protein, partial [unclassified Microcoleus]|uniref:hypothetical protein n=1 Tax=unclassified Microcoleus TaxID=2642155 RepID=UPI002FD6123A